MSKFIETYTSDILYAAIVIIIVVVLFLLTRTLQKWLRREITNRLPSVSVKPLNSISRILVLLWLILGVIALSFIFVDIDKVSVLRDYFKRFSYVGVVAIITIFAITLSNLWFKHKIEERVEGDNDPTNYKFLRYVVTFLLALIGALIASLIFPSLRGVAQTALGGAGIIALIAGFAAQEALANIVGGLFIIAFKPFKIGDRVQVTSAMGGTVVDITLRHTVIRNFENKMIVIPNAIMNKEKIINYNLGELKCCERIEIGIAYDSDIDLAKKIMQEECENHSLIYDNRSLSERRAGRPKVKTALIALNDFSITVRAWAWARNYSEAFSLKCDVLESIKKRFDKEGIEIPFPYSNVIMKKAEEKKQSEFTTEE